MIKIPSYLDCIKKIVHVTGIDYEDGNTKKFRMGDRGDFNTQKNIYADYMPKFLDLLGIEDNDIARQDFMIEFQTLFESQIRHLTSRNYYTLASNKRLMWGLSFFYYIPYIACFMCLYNTHFKIPKYLIDHDFMLPLLEGGKISSPTRRLKTYLNTFKKNDDNILFEYLENLKNDEIPSYKTLEEILKYIRSDLPELKEKELEISSLFKCAIISGNAYRDLKKLLQEKSDVISMFEYFRKCIKTIDRIIKEPKSIQSPFDCFLEHYLSHCDCEILYLNPKKNIWHHGIPKSGNFKLGRDLLLDQIEELREDIFSKFNGFLDITTPDTADHLGEIKIDDPLKGAYFLKTSSDNIYKTRNEIAIIQTLLEDLNDMFSPQNIIYSNQAEKLLDELKNHPYYFICENEYLYYLALNALAKNQFKNALNILKKYKDEMTEGETKLKIARMRIILKLLTDNKLCFSHLNSDLKMILDVEPQDEFMNDGSNIDYFRVLEIIQDFNIEGYAHYEGIECSTYNPFSKIEKFLEDFYELYDADSDDNELSEMKIESILKTLMNGRNAKYPIESNLVTLYNAKAKDIFMPVTFTAISLFFVYCKITSENVSRLCNNPKLLDIFSKLLSQKTSCLEWINIVPISMLGIDYEITIT